MQENDNQLIVGNDMVWNEDTRSYINRGAVESYKQFQHDFKQFQHDLYYPHPDNNACSEDHLWERFEAGKLHFYINSDMSVPEMIFPDRSSPINATMTCYLAWYAEAILPVAKTRLIEVTRTFEEMFLLRMSYPLSGHYDVFVNKMAMLAPELQLSRRNFSAFIESTSALLVLRIFCTGSQHRN